MVVKHQDWKGSFWDVLNDVMIKGLDKIILFRLVKQNGFCAELICVFCVRAFQAFLFPYCKITLI